MKIRTEVELTNAYKRLEEIEKELRLEYFYDGETDYASQLEVEYEQIEDAICKYEELNKKYHCEILSAIPKPHWGLVGTAEDKKAWIAKYLGEKVPVNIVYREEKKNFAKDRNCFLIDDLKKNIAEWNEYGGTGILFEGAENFDQRVIECDD